MPQRRVITGLFIPIAALASRELTSSQKLVLSQIHFLDRERGCYAKNGHIGELLGLSASQVCKIIGQLRRAGHIRWEPADNWTGRLLFSNLQEAPVDAGVLNVLRNQANVDGVHDFDDWGDD